MNLTLVSSNFQASVVTAEWKSTGNGNAFKYLGAWKLTDFIINIRFPRAGTPNAKSDLKIVTFKVNDKGEFVDILQLELPQPLGIMFPSAEYLTRAGWTPEGEQWIITTLNVFYKYLYFIFF